MIKYDITTINHQFGGRYLFGLFCYGHSRFAHWYSRFIYRHGLPDISWGWKIETPEYGKPGILRRLITKLEI